MIQTATNRNKDNLSILAVDYSDNRQVIGAMGQLWENRMSYKYVLERQWYMAIAWYLGLQNMVWADSVKRLTEQEAPSWRVRMVVNHLQAMVRTIGAKLHKANPEWDVLPASTDPSDAQKAYVANQVLTSNWERMLMGEKMMETLLWTLVNGNAFIKHTWNPDAGEPMYIPTAAAPGGDEPGSSGVETDIDPDMLGETDAEVVSGFEMIVDPRAVKFRDAAWCMHSKIVDVQDILDMYPKADIRPEDATYDFSFMQFKEHLKTLVARGNTYSRGGAASGSGTTSAIAIHELWIRPRRNSKYLKKGRFVVMANNKIIKNVAFPYLHGELPFAHFVEIAVPGRLWGTCTLEQMMPLQANYNRTRSQLVEIRNTLGNPRLLIPKGAGISAASITNRPGEQIHYNPGFKPEMLDAPQVPAYIANMLETDKLDMEDLSGIHEVSRAQAPGQIRSGRGVLALVEQDETRLGTVVKYFESGSARLGRQNLAVSAQFVTERRIIRIIGAQDELLVTGYRGSDLIGAQSGLNNISYFDVRVKTIAGMPHSRAAQQELLDGLLNRKVLDPANPKDKRLVLQLLSIGAAQNNVDKSRMHRSRQLVEIEKIIGGEPLPPLQWHEHEIHLEVLDEFRNSSRYDTLDDNIKVVFEQHAQGHKEWIAYNAVEPEILVRKAAMVAMMAENMNTVVQAAQQTQGLVPGMMGADGSQGESNGSQGNQSQGIRQGQDGGGSDASGGQSNA